MVELLAAANHRPALKAEMGGIARDVRPFQVEALATLLDEYGIDQPVPAADRGGRVQGLAFSAVQDQAAGYDTSPDEAIAAMSRLVDRLDFPAERPSPTPDRRRAAWAGQPSRGSHTS